MCDDGNPDFAQLGDRAMVRRVADLLGSGRCGIDDKLRLAPGAARELGKHRLSHRRAADISITDKQYTLHARFLSYRRLLKSRSRAHAKFYFLASLK